MLLSDALKPYQIVNGLIRNGLEEGKTVIVDASFRLELKQPGWETAYRELAQRTGALLKIVRLIIPEDILKQRLAERGSPYDGHKLISEEAWKAWFEEDPIEVEMPEGSLIIESSGDFPTIFEQVLAFIKTRTLEHLPFHVPVHFRCGIALHIGLLYYASASEGFAHFSKVRCLILSNFFP